MKDINLDYVFSISISLSLFSALIRNLLATLLGKLNISNLKKVVIYGAGLAGAQLANSLTLNKENNILFFVDDNSLLWSRSVCGFQVKNPKVLEDYNQNIDIIYLAIPSLSKIKKKNILNKLSNYYSKVLSVPSIEDITSGKSKISETRIINIEELIFRDLARSNKEDIKSIFKNKKYISYGSGRFNWPRDI